MSKPAWCGFLMLAACGSSGETAPPSDQQRSIEVAERCSTLSLEDCSRDPECATLAAMAVDADQRCLESEVPVVCTNKALGCDDGLAIVEVAGKRYRMSGICDTPGVDVVDATFTQGTPEFNQIAWGKCSTQLEPTTCAAGTTKIHPGCGGSLSLEKGCYAACSALGDDASCASGYTCQEAWIDPCVPEQPGQITCAACGAVAHLCMAAPAESKCAAGTEMVSPGCGAAKPTWEKGCYAPCKAVGNDAGCAPGYTCQQTWVDPCVPKPGEGASCDACGLLSHLCLAAPPGG
jgi:hypothetical protein